MGRRPALAVCAGFVFWAAFAYLYYVRDLGGAVVLSLFFIAGAVFYRWVRRRPPPPVPPKSDLPPFKFDDVKPKDFE
ncbi:MAG: hypothetical protein A3I72_13085 [Candidatus Tectomicrobia bacterium RIFCSPLOWO2_02_FULL_70_19]|nr:MAG: hypothetical protein A3I72_13085 [Candidatus Tectomicrobia bacterium RIFCSPLOWO2_02_FULL_70_19]